MNSLSAWLILNCTCPHFTKALPTTWIYQHEFPVCLTYPQLCLSTLHQSVTYNMIYQHEFPVCLTYPQLCLSTLYQSVTYNMNISTWIPCLLDLSSTVPVHTLPKRYLYNMNISTWIPVCLTYPQLCLSTLYQSVTCNMKYINMNSLSARPIFNCACPHFTKALPTTCIYQYEFSVRLYLQHKLQHVLKFCITIDLMQILHYQLKVILTATLEVGTWGQGHYILSHYINPDIRK